MKRPLRVGDIIHIGEGRSVEIVSIEGVTVMVEAIAPEHIRIVKAEPSGNTRALTEAPIKRRKATRITR